MSFQVWPPCKGPADRLAAAWMAKEVPTSSTSGALDWPFSWFTALISSWLDPSGFSETILMPYFLEKSLMMVP